MSRMQTNQFESIYNAHYKAAFQYAYHLCHEESIAEDLVQEAFLKYYKSLSMYRRECSELTWLCRIINNLWIDQLRKKKRIQKVTLTDLYIADNTDFVTQIENKDAAKRVHQILHCLPEPYKEVFSLRVFGELPFSEIADLYQRSESWARVTYGRAKMKIISRLDKEEKR